MKFAQEIIISWIMSFPASIVPIEFQIIRCISIQNGIPYLTDADKFKLHLMPIKSARTAHGFTIYNLFGVQTFSSIHFPFLSFLELYTDFFLSFAVKIYFIS